MATFRPCVDRTACTEEGTHCRACGRSHAEIAAVRDQVQQVVALIRELEYDNPQEYLDWLQRKVLRKLG